MRFQDRRHSLSAESRGETRDPFFRWTIVPPREVQWGMREIRSVSFAVAASPPLSPFPAPNQRAVNSIPAICALVSLTSIRLHPQIADGIADIPYILESYRPIENRASRRKSRTEKFQRLNKGS